MIQVRPEFAAADQRGLGKPSGRTDIGPFQTSTLALVVGNTDDIDDDDFTPGNLSLREAIRLANANPGLDTIEFDTGGVFAVPRIRARVRRRYGMAVGLGDRAAASDAAKPATSCTCRPMPWPMPCGKNARTDAGFHRGFRRHLDHAEVAQDAGQRQVRVEVQLPVVEAGAHLVAHRLLRARRPRRSAPGTRRRCRPNTCG